MCAKPRDTGQTRILADLELLPCPLDPPSCPGPGPASDNRLGHRLTGAGLPGVFLDRQPGERWTCESIQICAQILRALSTPFRSGTYRGSASGGELAQDGCRAPLRAAAKRGAFPGRHKRGSPPGLRKARCFARERHGPAKTQGRGAAVPSTMGNRQCGQALSFLALMASKSEGLCPASTISSVIR